jgi:DNA-binding MarR family transcriptional regulator
MEVRGADRSRFWAAYNLISAGDLLVAVYSNALHEIHLSRDEWRILVALDLVRESEPRRLAESLWLGRSTVVNATTRLEKRGFVEREPAANDHRLVIVRITDAGREIMELGARSQAETVNSLDWEMSDAEIDTLAALSRKVWRLNYRLVAKSIESSPRVGDATS